MLVLGCHRVESGVEPEPLGYGAGPHLTPASGYEPDPVPRASPTPWTPPEREARPSLAAVSPAPTEPLGYARDVVRVCEHITALDETQDTAKCLGRYRIAQVFRPIGQWKTLAACIEAATELRAIAACEQATPPTFAMVDAYPHESSVCMHVFALTIVEQLGPDPMLATERILEFEPLLRQCVNSLVTEERDQRNPSDYMKLLECIEGAQTTEGADACS
ncbi:hypothetical protein ENSA5_43020 [Enhygromyxa salina]|uniref:Uncharacterized protein n=2 Tax=Enhygromyxa salina TaxID=215803 RepID=A0A2S9XKM0_9BACT|nr:hypothetical protein ENSA5_43020 [Enhygromyxa salina]